MIKVLLVDCDDTLHANSLRLERQAEAVCGEFGVTAEEAKRAYFAAHDWIHLNAFDRHDDVPFHFERMGISFAHPVTRARAEELATAWQAAYDAYQRAPQVFPDARPSLERLQAAGIRLVLVSGSTDEERWQTLRALSLDDLFERVFSANTVGFQKKDPKFYEHVLQQLAVPANEIAIVGDHPLDDMHAAQFGIQTFLLVRSGEARVGDWKPDHIVSDLHAVATALLS